ncbi:MAG: M28 family peptidase [Planctomycetales bacterium]|nr:M28 family peptidase [Planctomycetales bacterium]
MFDGEEFIFDDRRDTYFLGSEYFARQYAQNPPAHRYEWGVLLDMVGDAQLEIYQEKYSMSWPKTRLLVQRIWKTADRLGVKEFIPRRRYEIRDDHLPLNTTAHIPTCDIIDFGYPQDSSFDRGKSYWHTTQDTPDKCSALSLAKVGWVVLEWLRTEK